MDEWIQARAAAIRDALRSGSDAAAAELLLDSARVLRASTGSEPTYDFQERILAALAAIGEDGDIERMNAAVAARYEDTRRFWADIMGRDIE
jgi:hypothetical protein